MKLFVLQQYFGSYSDRYDVLVGVFSSKEKVDEIIKERCTPVDIETKRAEYEECKKQESVSNKKRALEELPSLKNKLRDLLALQKKHGPEYAKSAIPETQAAIELRENIILNDKTSFIFRNLETYCKNKYPTSRESDFSINEVEVDTIMDLQS